MSQPVMLMIGTRPEGIKMMPVYFAFKKASIPVLLCSTSQHRDLLTDVFRLFNVRPDIELDVMQPGQDLFHITTAVLERTKNTLQQIKPRAILVQGDTTSAFASALAAFYLSIPVGHIEAGLRTGNTCSPFPEETNRKMISALAQLHFAPTPRAAANLLQEGIVSNAIFVTGNTIVDAAFWIKQTIIEEQVIITPVVRAIVEQAYERAQKIVLLTVHRRESLQAGIRELFAAIKEAASLYDDLLFVYPYHPNPQVLAAIDEMALKEQQSVILMPPLVYHDLSYVMNNASFVITDSGGICEEAVTIGKSVIITRNQTERMEAVWAGRAFLTGTNKNAVLQAIDRLRYDARTTECELIFGDGLAAERIVTIITERWMNDSPVWPLTEEHTESSLCN